MGSARYVSASNTDVVPVNSTNHFIANRLMVNSFDKLKNQVREEVTGNLYCTVKKRFFVWWSG